MLLDLDLETLAELIVQTTQEAVAPFHARVAALESELVTIKSAAMPRPEQPDLDARVKSLVDAGVAAYQKDTAAAERLAAIETKLLGMVETLAQFESKAAVPGPKGEPGEPGEPGERGESGPAGPVGERGLEGPVGIQGPAGSAGERGERGEKGEPGMPGERGAEGERGADGAKGNDGRDGVDGKDGAVGAAGERGPEGVKGLDGAPGRDGRDGLAGATGPTGEKGLDGAAGLNGKDGRDGLDGTLEGLEVQQLDDRRIAFKRASGATLGVAVIPAPLDAGIYREGQSYAKGDGVTYAGSFWIAQAETTDKPGDGVTSWRLAVKRGRDGKEGKPGPEGSRGQKGDPGTPGRDYR